MSDRDDDGEFLNLVELAISEDADAAQLDRLAALLKQDEHLRDQYAQLCSLEVELLRVFQSPLAPHSMLSESSPTAGSATSRSTGSIGTAQTRMKSRAGSWIAIAASLALLAFLIGLFAGRTGQSHLADRTDLSIAPHELNSHAYDSASLPSQLQTERGVSVKLTKAMHCVWGRGAGRGGHLLGAGMDEGERLELLEGFATLSVHSQGWQATIQIEGPASIVITSDGLPALRYGKMLVETTRSSDDRLSVGLPYADVYLMPDSSIGVGVFGSTCEVHAFQGAASLKAFWRLDDSGIAARDDAHVVFAGSSVQLQVTEEGSLTLQEGAANRGMFDAEVLVRGGELIVTKDYVGQVLSAKPVAYWRFEEPVGGLVENAVSEDFKLCIHGDIQFDGLTGNRCVAFPMNTSADHPRFLSTKEPLSDRLPDDYAIEFWVNPSHYHTATILALVVPELGQQEPSTYWIDSPNSEHGLVIELGGYSGLQRVMRPRKIRYLHRNPPSQIGGQAVYSDRTYSAREWQHIVCRKSDSKIQVYCNGTLQGQSADPSNLPTGLIAVLGQLSDSRFERPFYGRIDEMAIYDHVLTDEQIRAHYEAAEFIGQPSEDAPPTGGSSLQSGVL